MISVPNYKALKALPLSQIDDVAYVTNEDRYYVYQSCGWVCTDLQKSLEGLNYEATQYDLNKQIMSQLSPLDADALKERVSDLNQWVNDFGTKTNGYFMLLCKELSYYTIIHTRKFFVSDTETFGDVIVDCLSNIGTGDIYAIDINDDNAFEAWIKCDDEMYCVLLFDYFNGVVEVGV